MAANETKKQQRWKGFTLEQLQAFGARPARLGMEVPYFTRERKHYRTKLFTRSGQPRSLWLGDSKPQIPYGLWRLPAGGDAVILTEGESDAWALWVAFPKTPVLALPGSQSWKTEWTVYLDDFRRVYLSFDGDPGGDGRHIPGKRPQKRGTSLRERVLADIPEARPLLLPDLADTRDVIQRLGRAAYKALVELADRSWENELAYRAMSAAVARRHQLVQLPWEKLAA